MTSQFDAADLALAIEGLYSDASDNPCRCASDPESHCPYCSAWATALRRSEILISEALSPDGRRMAETTSRLGAKPDQQVPGSKIPTSQSLSNGPEQ